MPEKENWLSAVKVCVRMCCPLTNTRVSQGAPLLPLPLFELPHVSGAFVHVCAGLGVQGGHIAKYAMAKGRS